MEPTDAHRIAALIERIGRLLTTDAHAEGLLPVQWEVLRYLQRANRFSKSPAAVTAYLGVTKGTVSQTLNTLEARGLIRKTKDPRDRRARRLALAARGRKLLVRDPLAATVAAIGGLDSRQRDALARGLESVLSSRLAAQQRRPFGQCRDCRYFARQHADGGPHYCLLLEEPLAKEDRLSICHEQNPAA